MKKKKIIKMLLKLKICKRKKSEYFCLYKDAYIKYVYVSTKTFFFCILAITNSNYYALMIIFLRFKSFVHVAFTDPQRH